MDSSLVKKMIEQNRPFRIKTAGGDVYDVPHRDFISFSPRRTTLFVSYVENGKESVAYIPLQTVASLEGEPEKAER